MRFDEVSLYEAVYDVRRDMEFAGEKPGSDKWVVDEAGRVEVCRRVLDKLTMSSEQYILDAFISMRKQTSRKLDLTVEVGRYRGWNCFYGFAGNCCYTVSLDRIKPGTAGGKYTVANCVIACKTHNSMRGDMPIEQFLERLNGTVTDS